MKVKLCSKENRMKNQEQIKNYKTVYFQQNRENQ